jgi:hypothetical protein
MTQTLDQLSAAAYGIAWRDGQDANEPLEQLKDRLVNLYRTGQLVAVQPEQPTCMLCAGKCRGHSLADSKAWEPEPGSQAFAVQPDDVTVERAKWALKNASRGGLSEELCGIYVREVLASLAAKGTGDE